MKLIYHKHQTSNGMDYSYWDSDYYLCDTEEEYEAMMKELQEKLKWAEEDYAKRGYADYTPTLSSEGKVKAREYFYAHEWTGKNFDAVGFNWCERDSYGSRTTYYLKPGSVTPPTYPKRERIPLYGS